MNICFPGNGNRIFTETESKVRAILYSSRPIRGQIFFTLTFKVSELISTLEFTCEKPYVDLHAAQWNVFVGLTLKIRFI